MSIMLNVAAYAQQGRYTAYVYTNHRRIKRFGNDLRQLISNTLRHLDNEFTYGWCEIIDNSTNQIVHRSRKAAY